VASAKATSKPVDPPVLFETTKVSVFWPAPRDKLKEPAVTWPPPVKAGVLLEFRKTDTLSSARSRTFKVRAEVRVNWV
jgi:hypothetical protein